MTFRGHCINLAHCSAFTALGIVMAIFVLVGYWAFLERSGTGNIYTHPTALITPAGDRSEIVEAGPLKSGDTFFVYAEYCSPPYPTTLTPYFQNSIIVRLPDRTGTGNGECRKVSFRYKVPENMPAGVHYLRRRVKIVVNPLKTEAHELPSVKVEVVK